MNDEKIFNNLRTAVIGVGSMGKNHARIFNDLSNLVFVSDLDESQGQKIANIFGTKYYKNFEEGLEEVDAVSIVVPTKYHYPVAKKISKFDISSLIEKPLSDNIQDSNSIVSLYDSGKNILSVGHIERYNPVITKAKEYLSNNKWGKIRTINAKRFSPYPQRIQDVGVLFDLAIHDVDLLRFLFEDDVTNVYAWAPDSSSHHDIANIVLQFSNGSFGFSQTNWRYPIRVREINITTTTHNIILDLQNQKISEISFDSSNNEISEKNLFSSGITVKKVEPLYNEIFDFLSSVNENRSPKVTGQDGYEAVKIIESAIKSINNKKIIHL